MVSMVNTAALGAVEFAVNRALTMDPASQRKLAEMSAIRFHLQTRNPELDLFLFIAENGEISLQDNFVGKTDCAIEGEFRDLLGLLSAKDKTNALINSGLKINGDSRHLIQLQEILADLELDWEAQLAKLTGDVVAHQIGKGVRSFLKWRQYAHERLAANFTEYLQEEGRFTPPKLEVEDFYMDIRELGMRVERLQARLKKLEKSRSQS